MGEFRPTRFLGSRSLMTLGSYSLMPNFRLGLDCDEKNDILNEEMILKGIQAAI